MKEEPEEVANITLVSLRTLAAQIGFSADTIDGWCRAGTFPRPIVAKPGSPRRWRLKDIQAWIEQRRRARHVEPAPRGRLRRGAS